MKAPHTVIYDIKNVEKRRFEGIALEKKDNTDVLEHNPNIGAGKQNVMLYYKLIPGEYVIVYL